MNNMHIMPNYISKKYAIQNYQISPQSTKNNIDSVRGAGGFLSSLGRGDPHCLCFCIPNLWKMAHKPLEKMFATMFRYKWREQ